ncbi:YceD family protein [Alkanindiges sp. WGS2144]|uniref:YceD family protein n=1 Tax=Alkanindiges sp. WGS2144 TaxID=3366808 RepID=UPI003750126D
MSANHLSSQLPTHIEPFKWAEQGFNWSGRVPLDRFSRIASETCASADSSDVQVDVRLSMDEYQRIAWLDATLAATVTMTCQRCLEPVDLPVSTQVHLALLMNENQVERLDEDADFVILGEEQTTHDTEDVHVIDLIELLEDELLLSMPISPRHESCENLHQPVVEDEPETEKRDNPFEVLASLKGKLNS